MERNVKPHDGPRGGRRTEEENVSKDAENKGEAPPKSQADVRTKTTFARKPQREIDICWCAIMRLNKNAAKQKEGGGQYAFEEIAIDIKKEMATDDYPPPYFKITNEEILAFSKKRNWRNFYDKSRIFYGTQRKKTRIQ